MLLKRYPYVFLCLFILAIFLRSGPPVTAVANVTAAKVDSLVVDNGDAGVVDPGDTIRYTVTITNSGTVANSLTYNDTIDSNTTLVAGSLRVSPLARDDSFTATGNVQISVPSGSGVLANDYWGRIRQRHLPGRVVHPRTAAASISPPTAVLPTIPRVDLRVRIPSLTPSPTRQAAARERYLSQSAT